MNLLATTPATEIDSSTVRSALHRSEIPARAAVGEYSAGPASISHFAGTDIGLRGRGPSCRTPVPRPCDLRRREMCRCHRRRRTARRRACRGAPPATKVTSPNGPGPHPSPRLRRRGRPVRRVGRGRWSRQGLRRGGQGLRCHRQGIRGRGRLRRRDTGKREPVGIFLDANIRCQEYSPPWTHCSPHWPTRHAGGW
jgi:hypothetical protein